MKVIYSLYFIFISFFFSASASAGLLRIESDTFFSNRMGDNKKKESPFFEEFQASYHNSLTQWNADFDFGYYYDFDKDVYRLDLNQLYFKKEDVLPGLVLSAGRTFESKNLIHSSIADSLSLEYKIPWTKIRTGILLGALRSFEFDKYSGRAPVYSWFVDFKTEELFPLYANLKIERNDYSDFNRSVYNTVALNLKKDLNHAEVFGTLKEGLTLSNSYLYQLGFHFYPQYDWTFGLDHSVSDKNQLEGFQKPIFNTFSTGRVQDYAISAGHTFTPAFYSGFSFGMSNYYVQIDQKTKGHKVDWSFQYRPQNFFLNAQLFYLKSFGGNAYGQSFNGEMNLNDYIDLLLENEWIKYDKITSAKNQAGLIRFGSGTKYFKPFKLQALGEISSNNFYKEEWAFFLRFTFVDWREI